MSDDKLQEAFQDLGINDDTLVVVYGQGDVPVMTGCRIVWALMYAGVKDVRFMNGGFKAWQDQGGQL